MPKASTSLPHVTAERLREVLDYDPETGLFTWRGANTGKGCKTTRAGKGAGHINAQGYVTIGVGGRNYPAHRLAFLWMTGSCPSEVDHRNQIKADNSWRNLREATRGQNIVNCTKRRKHDLPRGVRPRNNSPRFQAMIGGRHLGMYDTPGEAHAAYRVEAHRLYGEFLPD
jgi:hypothetical protein